MDSTLRTLERAALSGDSLAVQRFRVASARAGLPVARPHALLLLTENVAGHIRTSISRIDNELGASWTWAQHPVQELCCCSNWTNGEYVNHDSAHIAECQDPGFWPAVYGA